MSYHPKKGMHNNEQGVAVFDNPAAVPTPGGGKRWWLGKVTREVVNGKGDVLRRSKQQALVFAKEADVVAMVCRQCTEITTVAEGDVRTKVSYGPA